MSAIDKARQFRALHDHGTFVLANAWDAASAALIADAGAPALATTSSGVSWSLGLQGGEGLTRASGPQRRPPGSWPLSGYP